MQLLCAFVQSNHDSLHPVLSEASERLQAQSGDSSFAGYQFGGPARVMEMLDAIHQTLSQPPFDLTYINPPPSFEQSGQKVRLVADTLQQQRGTCLDLAVLQAALWEHIGLHPLLVVIPGHAFLACWLEERTADEVVVELGSGSSGHALLSAIEAGSLLPLNSVEVTADKSLQQAVDNGKRYIETTLDRDGYVYMIDVHLSRQQITPLP